MAAAGKGWAERASRAVKTVWFVVALLASLLVASAPALMAAGDVAVALWLEVRLGCLRCHGLRDHLQRYSFRNSLADIPLVSVVRTLVITCKPRCLLSPHWCFLERSSVESRGACSSELDFHLISFEIFRLGDAEFVLFFS
jgi:hypothetical protein